MPELMQNKPVRVSAANLTVPGKPKAAPRAGGGQSIIDRLRVLIADAGTNKNDQVTVAIAACIGEELNTSDRIFEVLARLGFNTRHVALILRDSTGTVAAQHRWARDDKGRYRLLT